MRRILWIARVLLAAARGAVVRALRRVLRRPPRIWHGFTPLHATAWMVQSERAAGFPSLSVATNTRASRYALVRADDFDVVLETSAERWDDVQWLALEHLLLHGDIWSAYFDCLFFERSGEWKNEWTFRLIRLAGIRIVVQPHGSDLLCIGKYESRYGWPERAQRDYPTWDLTAQREVVDLRLRLFRRHAHFVVAGDILYEPVIERWDASFHTVAVDVEGLAPEPRPRSEIPVVMHAPNHRHVKGTELLLEALGALEARGFRFELRLIERVPRHEALQLYRHADVIADQFTMGAFGIFALEAMSLGKTVLAYLDDEHLRRPAFAHPIVNTTPENLMRVLAVVLSVPELRDRIGQASRESVVRYQSFAVMADVWSRIYKHVWWGRPLELEMSPIFDPHRLRPTIANDPASPAFWPAPVDDLMPQIVAALQRLG